MPVLSNQAPEPELTSPETEVAKMDDMPAMEVGNPRPGFHMLTSFKRAVIHGNRWGLFLQ